MSGESIVNSAKTPERDLGWSRQFGLEAERPARDGLRGKGGRRRQERPTQKGALGADGGVAGGGGPPFVQARGVGPGRGPPDTR